MLNYDTARWSFLAPDCTLFNLSVYSPTAWIMTIPLNALLVKYSVASLSLIISADLHRAITFMICTNISGWKNKPIRSCHVISLKTHSVWLWWRWVEFRLAYVTPSGRSLASKNHHFYPLLGFCVAPPPPVSTPFFAHVVRHAVPRSIVWFSAGLQALWRTGVPLFRRILIDDKCPFQFRHCFRAFHPAPIAVIRF